MKKYNFYFGTMCIVLGLLPILLLRDMSIIYENLTEIISSLGGLMTITILATAFGADEKCLSITKKAFEIETTTDFFTVPVLCIVFLLEMVMFYLIDPLFIKENFNIFTGIIGSIMGAYVIYIIFGGTYTPIITSQKKSKVGK